MTNGDILFFGILFSPIWMAAFVRMKAGLMSRSTILVALLILNLVPILGLALLLGVGGIAYTLPVLTFFLGMNLIASAAILAAFGKSTAIDKANPK